MHFAFNYSSEFVQSWGIRHETSSLHHLRSDDQAEGTIKVSKMIMKEAKVSGIDVYMELLHYYTVGMRLTVPVWCP